MRVLLTGASGYVGLHLLRALLAADREVTALVRDPARLGPLAAHPRVRVSQVDLEDEARVAAALLEHEVCVHAALLWGEAGTELEMRDTAVAAKLFHAAGRAGVSRCVYLSSAAVHRPFSAQMAETDPIHTADLYGATKAAGELVLRAACATHDMRGLVLRLGPVVGAPAFPEGAFRTDSRIRTIYAAVVAGQAIDLPAAAGRQLVDVAVVARAVLALTEAPAPEDTYLCVAPEVTPWADVARVVAEVTGASKRPVFRGEPPTAPNPTFRTERLARLLGVAPSAADALRAHIGGLAAGGRG